MNDPTNLLSAAVEPESLVPLAKPFPEGHWLRRRIIPRQPEPFLSRTEGISLIIPTLNEEESIRHILPYAKEYCDELIVVDGHSRDRTRLIAEEFGAICILDNRKGKGDAIRTGIRRASHPILVFMDADLSHDPADIPRLVEPILTGNADHVIGSRPRGGSDELHGDFEKFLRMMGSDLITLGINYRFRAKITDSQNGFRAIRKSMASHLDLRERITTIEQELTIKTLARGYRLLEVPTHEYARCFGTSRIRLRSVALRYVYSWIKYLFFS